MELEDSGSQDWPEGKYPLGTWYGVGSQGTGVVFQLIKTVLLMCHGSCTFTENLC
jgi:hypothetical protein